VKRYAFTLGALAVALLCSPILGQERGGRVSLPAFGSLESVGAEAAEAKVRAFLKDAGADVSKVEAIFKQNERAVLDRVADCLAQTNETAAKLLAEARNPFAPAPTKVAEFFKDAKVPAFVRANVALSYARALSNRRIHEEALDVLKLLTPEQVIDPATLLFHKAVCEHSLLKRDLATKSINRLLEDAVDAPERYKSVAALILLDMQTWKDKDLGAVARLMDNSERRLQLARGGDVTQAIQKDIIRRLDELIKEKENQCKNCSQCNGGGCPSGGQQPGGNQPGGANNPSAPAPDFIIVNQGGSGQVQQQRFNRTVEQWGSLPEHKRAEAIQELTRGLSPRHREAIEAYFRNLANNSK